jgi:hypothetical protein
MTELTNAWSHYNCQIVLIECKGASYLWKEKFNRVSKTQLNSTIKLIIQMSWKS